LATPLNASQPQSLHFEPLKPNTMAPWSMAEFLILLDQALGRTTFSPHNVVEGIHRFAGWAGDKPHMRWKGLLFWHCQSCHLGHCGACLPWWANVRRCGTLRVLLHMATQGIQPELWTRHKPDSKKYRNTEIHSMTKLFSKHTTIVNQARCEYTIQAVAGGGRAGSCNARSF